MQSSKDHSLLVLALKSRAFTLVEVLIALMLSGMVMTALGLLFSSALVAFRHNSDIVNITQTAEAAGLVMQSEIVQAGAYLGPDPRAGNADDFTTIAQIAEWPFIESGTRVPRVEVRANTNCPANTLGNCRG
ncbi:MAG: prepilin-type N-terminal cleavage/methylation domain-containing protein [Synechococcaceae cyanobacterium SM2_3_60]|nr:prepilin-type N-terminal cleavage/methylation domain-containing protein [Synechococcaceae cyanobacterium SM2_3_60]